ncbi:MAG: MFS transporter [Deltaproteobacteria bacterium]|nr:MFS transporter [Deltaproteobacteria bacterium]
MQTDRGASSPAYPRYVLGVLWLVYVANFVDRQVIAILLEPIKRELGASDTAMGFLSGFAFALFYTFAGIPVARWADRSSRTAILAAGVAVWSLFTAASGLARSFAELALARVGVGIGEAAGTPPSHSLISAYFPPGSRATALSIYASGVYVGSMLAYLGGSWVLTHFDWRTVYLLVGLPGIALALLVRFTVREPPRAAPSGAVTGQGAAPGTLAVIRELLSRRSFVFIVLAGSCQSLSGYATLAWGPAFLGRVHGLAPVEIGAWLGLVIGIGGSLGVFLGGMLADRLGAIDPRWVPRLCALQCLSSFPFLLGFLLLGTPRAALLCFAPAYTLAAMYVGPMLAMVQGIARPETRATASALHLFILNMVGLGAGPLLVGLGDDRVFAAFGSHAIRYSLVSAGVIAALGSLVFLLVARTLRADLADASEPARR